MSVLKYLKLTRNEINAYNAIISFGVCEAKDICYKTHIASSKIYIILEKLENLGLIEIQQSRPKKIRVLNSTITYDNLYNLKKREYEEFKKELLQFKSYIEKRTANTEKKEDFWNVAVNYNEIIKKHISKFYFVENFAFIRINLALLRMLNKSRVSPRTIYDNFKSKKIKYKLIIGYNQTEKPEIMKWLESRPEKPTPQHDIRILEEKNSNNNQLFGIFDQDKIILFYKDPIDLQKILTSVFMTNKERYNELYSLFMSLWDNSEIIY
ncbi:MAG: helix-turn-helix domain-containing protein [Candidatus Helarchaeota archaeon]